MPIKIFLKLEYYMLDYFISSYIFYRDKIHARYL